MGLFGIHLDMHSYTEYEVSRTEARVWQSTVLMVTTSPHGVFTILRLIRLLRALPPSCSRSPVSEPLLSPTRPPQIDAASIAPHLGMAHPKDDASGLTPHDAQLFLGRAYECGFPRGYAVQQNKTAAAAWYAMAARSEAKEARRRELERARLLVSLGAG